MCTRQLRAAITSMAAAAALILTALWRRQNGRAAVAPVPLAKRGLAAKASELRGQVRLTEAGKHRPHAHGFWFSAV